MAEFRKKISEETLRILSRVTVKGNVVYLTCGQLDRKQYVSVNEILVNIGGKWNKKEKGHIFPTNPTDNIEQVLLSGEIIPPKKNGYFPTPPDVARKLISLANIQPGMKVLEPSAGQGGISDFVPLGCLLDCIELLEKNVEVLKSKNNPDQISRCADFMAEEANPVYDRVVMNPPFEKQADVDHVIHAWDCLRPGGRLVSIMSAGVVFRENRKTIAFRELLDSVGYLERLPEGSFRDSGTGVNTCIVVMDKP